MNISENDLNQVSDNLLAFLKDLLGDTKMDFLPGEILPLVLGQDTAIVLGKTHAALHDANSSRLSEDMIADGFEERQNNIKAKLDRLLSACGYLPWLEVICKAS